MSAHGMSEAGGLREAVEAVLVCPHGPRHYYAADATCQRCQMPSWVEAAVRAALPAPEADPTAGERVEHDLWWGYLCPALANIGALKDAQRDLVALGTDWAEAGRILSRVQSFYVDAAHDAARRYLAATPDAGDASASASEPLSDDERAVLSVALHGKGHGDWLTGGPLVEAVERIVAAREAAAEQRGREDNADHGMCYVHGSAALAARENEVRAEAGEQAWDEGYQRGLRDAEQDVQHGADNPYRADRIARDVTR